MFHVKHSVKGVIIDFNGTLYLDHDLNYQSWSNLYNKLKPKEFQLEYDNFDRTGLVNDYLLIKAMFKLFNIEYNDKDIGVYSKEKESEYRELAIREKRDRLIEGADTFLSFLKDNNIPYCIASMAPIENFDFYLDYLKLNKWFNYNNIVYDNGLYMDKNSQIVEAAKRMNLDLKDCLVIEDTPDNIEQAINKLKVENVIYINTRKKEYKAKEVIQEINNYTELDYSIFKN